MPEEDRDEWTLGVALVHYSMTAGLEKFKEEGEAGVSKELKQMHDMEVFRPMERFTIEGGKDQGGRVSNVPQGEEGSLGESKDVRRRAEAEG